VLLVDDAPFVREALAETLRAFGMIVIEAESPIDAIRISSEHPNCIDLLIVDIEMPEMSGWTLASQIVSRMDHIRVLYISGGVDADEWKAHPHRVTDSQFLAKPFTVECLARTLDTLARVRNITGG
jgi:CheY-like chemotaxis protein